MATTDTGTFPRKFGKYILTRKIAMGGMAEIFRAKTVGAEGFEKDIVIKRILPHYTEDEDFVTMFIDEAKVTSKLQHANITQIFDFDVEDDCYYIAMEYVEGKDLKNVMEDGLKAGTPLTVPHCVSIIGEICKGLHYAHTRTDKEGNPLNIVHRDISPHNAMVSFTGEVKLMDFGIAKAAQRSTKTVAGTVKGKCAYMSPEQARGKPLDGRSDLFAIGIVLWEMLTNKRLFLGESDFMTLSNVLKQEVPPPSSINPDVPPELDAIVAKSLAKDRDERYADVEAFNRELTRWYYASVEDLDAMALKPYMQKLYAEEIEKLRAVAAAEREMDFQALVSEQSATRANDAQMAGTMSGPQAVSNEAATQAITLEEYQQSMGGTATGAEFQQSTGAYAQQYSGTGTFAGQPKKGKGGLIAVIVLILLLGGGGAAWYFTMGPGKNGGGAATAQNGGEANPETPADEGAILRVNVEPENAIVTVNGRPLLDGEMKGLKQGSKVLVEARAEGYKTVEEFVEIDAASKSHMIKLEEEKAADAALLIKPKELDAKVIVDGKELGTGPQATKCNVGESVIVELVAAAGGMKEMKKVECVENMPAVEIALPGPAPAEITVICKGPGGDKLDDAKLTADNGTVSDSGGTWKITGLKVGDEVEIECRRSGLVRKSEKLKISEPKPSVELKLGKIPVGYGSVFIQARPWAKCTVDGSPKGTTPITARQIKNGSHRVVCSKGGQTQSKTVSVKINQRASVFFSFD